jgi:hypothetical protein
MSNMEARWSPINLLLVKGLGRVFRAPVACHVGVTALIAIHDDMGFYVQHNGHQLGPYTLAELRSQLTSGALSRRDPVWWEGQAGWVPLAESTVFDPNFRGSPAPPSRSREPSGGKSTFAVATLVMALLSLVCGPFTSVWTIVLGHCALSELRKNPRMTGRSAAIVGLSLGYVITLVYAALIGAYFYLQDELTRQAIRERAIQAVAPMPRLPSPRPPASSPASNLSPATNAPPAQPGAGTNTPAAPTNVTPP